MRQLCSSSNYTRQTCRTLISVCIPCPCSHAPSCFVLLHPYCLHLSAWLCHASDLLFRYFFLALPFLNLLPFFFNLLSTFPTFADAVQIFLQFQLYSFLAFLFGTKQANGHSRYAAKRLSLYSIDRIKWMTYQVSVPHTTRKSWSLFSALNNLKIR